MRYLFAKITFFFLTAPFVSLAFGDVVLPRLISDGAILQRDTQVALWGWADTEEQVSIFLDGEKLAETQAKNGAWKTSFQSLSAGGPHTLEFRGKNQIQLKNIYFGDVWVASGQSNMETSMGRVQPSYPNDVAEANFPQIREFTVPRGFKFGEEVKDYTDGEWQPTTPESVLRHSATAYYFSRAIHKQENVPVGIIGANLGGSGAECWMNLASLEGYPELFKKAESYRDKTYLESVKSGDQKAIEAWEKQVNSADQGSSATIKWSDPNLDHSSWETVLVPGRWKDQGIDAFSGVMWLRRTIELSEAQASQAEKSPAKLLLGTIVDADIAYINGKQVGTTAYQYPPRRYTVEPGMLHAGRNTLAVRVRVDSNNGGFVPEKPYALVLGDEKIELTGLWRYKVATTSEPAPSRNYTPWNEPTGCYYAMMPPLFNLSIKGVIWYQGESNTGRTQEYESLFPDMISLWRNKWNNKELPFLFVQLPNYMMAQPEPQDSGWAELRNAQLKTLKTVPHTGMAVTIDVGEWNDIHPLNKKAVGERLAKVALAKVYNHDIVYSGPLLKKAVRKGKKVVLTFDHKGSGLVSNGADRLFGFSLADKDGKFQWAQAVIKNNKVIVWHPNIRKPVKLRYAWADNPDTANLFNKEGLPASPFEVDL